MEGRLLCNLSLGEKKCRPGDRLAVIDNRSVNWIVKLEKFDGSVAEVPSLMIQLVGMDDDARGRCLSIRKKFEKLWTKSVIEWSRLFLRYLNGANVESSTREDKQRHLEFIRVAKNEIGLVENGEEFHEIFDRLNKAVRGDKKFSDLDELNRILTTFKAFISQWKVYAGELDKLPEEEKNLIESPKIEYVIEDPIEQNLNGSYITTQTKLEENRQTVTRKTIYCEIDPNNFDNPISDQSTQNNHSASKLKVDLSDSSQLNHPASLKAHNLKDFEPEEEIAQLSTSTISSNCTPDSFRQNANANNKEATLENSDKPLCKAYTTNGDRGLSVLYLDEVDDSIGKVSEEDKVPYQTSTSEKNEIKIGQSNKNTAKRAREEGIKKKNLQFGQLQQEDIKNDSTSSLSIVGAETTIGSIEPVKTLSTAVVAETNQLVSAEQEETSKFVITAVIHPSTRRRIDLQQAVKEGIIRSDRGVYIDRIKGKEIPIAEAMNNGLIIVENVTKELGREKYHDMGLITIQDGKGQSMTFAIRSIVDEKLNKKIPFTEAINKGLLNKETGVYLLNKSNQELELPEAVKKGYVKAQVIDNPSSLDGIHPHNVVVVEKVSAIKKKMLKPMAVVNSMKKSAEEGSNKKEH
ncbi:DgyrCDS13075 [Dimorphilus gyrociliatus]|uniref:DgyrCDS13075 n=1 Tax=Dimorphilus gyrociliatus TaxID=2664684 RepID=A0A7I8W9N0_9ANNE|nr:DgyrCDS13075 [Dimorphilus gyrociliatus]